MTAVRILPLAIITLLLLVGTAGATIDATFVWNASASTYEFPQINTGTPSGETFAQAFATIGSHTQTFSTAFAGILSHIAAVEGTGTPSWGGDDEMKASVQNWPSP